VKPSSQTSIIGTWHFSKTVYTPITNGVAGASTTTNYDGKETLTFKTDGTGIDTNGTTYFSEPFKYSISSNDITITYTGQLYNQYTGTIKQINNTSLEIFYGYPLFTSDNFYTK
jgi:hypothetical protein